MCHIHTILLLLKKNLGIRTSGIRSSSPCKFLNILPEVGILTLMSDFVFLSLSLSQWPIWKSKLYQCFFGLGYFENPKKSKMLEKNCYNFEPYISRYTLIAYIC